MSLVAYGSSDEESDTSDSEEVQNSGVSKQINASDHQEDSKKPTFAREGSEKFKERGLILLSPEQTGEISNSTGRKASLSSFLPKPQNVNKMERESTRGQGLSPDSKPLVSLTTMVDDDDDEIIEIEDEYEPIAKRKKIVASSEGDNKPKSVGSLFSLLPTPWQAENTWQKGADLKKKTNSKQSAVTSGTKQPIKIAIPTAPKNDSDEEDDMPAAKKFTPSKEGSGLKSLLPKPKHSITLKVDNPNKPSVKLASRPLIPHTLTKNATITMKKPQKTAKKNQAEDAVSDDEDEPVSFFTFTDKSESLTDENVETFSSHDTKPSTGVELHEPSLEVTSPSVLSFPQGKMSSTAAASQRNDKHLAAAIPSLQVMEEPGTQTDFGNEESLSTGESETRTYYYEQQSGKTQQYGGYSASDYENYSYEPSSSLVNQPYYSQESETYTYTYPRGTATQAQNQPQETDIDLEKLQKLKGRRNRHEEINIVDVNADDQIGNSADMVAKYGTEEIAHRPSRKKKDMPTAQQRRKHQITYLAFQAKEREFELRQQWSANRQTRRQTQSKYGF